MKGHTVNEIDYFMLCVKDLKNEINSQDKIILTQWLKNSSRNQEVYNQCKRMYRLENQIKNTDNISKETIWNELYDKIQKEQYRQLGHSSILNQLNNIQLYKYRRLGIVLSFLFLFFFMIIYMQYYIFRTETESIVTRNKEKRTVILSDQSKVILNSDSRLEYPKVFKSNERFVQLDGEAFFTIRKDSIPFIVKSKNANISVLGTEFNVWARDNETRVAVKNGQVRLSPQEVNNDNFVMLYKNQMSFVKDKQNPQTPKNIDMAIYLDWLENRLVFNKTPLTEVIAEIERSYDVSIHLDEKLQDRLLTAQFADTSIEPVLKKICLVFHTRYSYKEYVYFITY